MNGPTAGGIPTWTLANRMARSLEWSGVSVGEMAEFLGVTRGTASAYKTGRHKPDTRTLRLWAERCGVDYQWLTEGAGSDCHTSS